MDRIKELFSLLRASMFNSLILINSIERKFSNSLILDFYTSQEWREFKNYFAFAHSHSYFNSLILKFFAEQSGKAERSNSS